ncbi:MAG: GntR family transcriptional regulator [Terracidiphilus sp.]
MPKKKNPIQRGVKAQGPGTTIFLKETLAEKLRDQIMRGNLTPGQRIIESRWARQFDVAQISIREAINLLIADGFVAKATGRSARVVHFSHDDIAQIYEMRAALEGLAARLAAERKAELSSLQASIAEMRQAIARGDIRALLGADLRFHMELCRVSGNHRLYVHARSLLIPFFAFIAVRATQVQDGARAWKKDLTRHQRIVDVIHEGDPLAAEFSVRAILQHFVCRAEAIWGQAP